MQSCRNMDSHSPNKTGELLRLTDITLNYDHFTALNHIHLTIKQAEVHAIVGEHGAGKSSLGMILSGMLKPKSGRIVFEGREFSALTLKTALKLGIEMVYQEVCLNEHFTVAENLFFASAAMNAFRWNKKKHILQATQRLFASYGFEIDPGLPLKHLNLSDRALVDILKHIYPNPKLLILDEALEKLSSPALKKIIAILKTLKQQGLSILFITHRIDDVYDFADRVSIIKNGEILLTDDVKNIDKINLIKMTYTQIVDEKHVEDLNTEFYQLLRYNEAILRNLPVNLIVLDNEKRIKMVNEHCKQHFQLRQDAYVNAPLHEFFAKCSAKVLELLDQACSVQQETTFYQIPILINTIDTLNNIKILPIYDGSFLIGNIMILEDITEYDHLQKQMMLSEKLASVGLLAAGVAHEINNPLEIIYNSLKYLKYRIYDQELQEAVDDIQEEMTSIANIVSNLHTFSDNKQSTSEEVEVNVLIHNMLNLIRFNAKYKHITIHFDPCEADTTIQANKNEIKQVLLNLFKNSFEVMPSGGEIFINTRLARVNGAPVVQIQFKDTGPGISDDNPANVFLPFYSTKKGDEHNLGLGLSVSYGIIKKYHGAMSVENLENSGCQFTMTLPQSP
ncbi:histidine kinase [Candidatus Vecturithrix granuli]|uniref:histidine kinase n=1 Tax=Vecturithrix granuli TaxID=1499967 RepID=A0A0S6WB99_VECG1|nr:histidine kinase [Candidatus Vecturithrix granuli]